MQTKLYECFMAQDSWIYDLVFVCWNFAETCRKFLESDNHRTMLETYRMTLPLLFVHAFFILLTVTVHFESMLGQVVARFALVQALGCDRNSNKPLIHSGNVPFLPKTSLVILLLRDGVPGTPLNYAYCGAPLFDTKEVHVQAYRQCQQWCVTQRMLQICLQNEVLNIYIIYYYYIYIIIYIYIYYIYIIIIYIYILSTYLW